MALLRGADKDNGENSGPTIDGQTDAKPLMHAVTAYKVSAADDPK